MTEQSLEKLIPLIRNELIAGEEAGAEHFRKAGEMLIEAKKQVKHGHWSNWLDENFDLSYKTAAKYMQLARHISATIHPEVNYGKSMAKILNEKEIGVRKPSREKEVADAMGIKITHKPPAREYPKRNLTYPMNILREVTEYIVCYSPEELNELKRLCDRVSKAIENHQSKEGNVTWLRQSSNT